LQPAFAHLRQTDPALATLYRTRRLWDDAPADAAGTELSVRLIASLEAQRQTLSDSMSSKLTLIWSPLRWLLTIGALLWFPLVQPILETALNVSGKLSVRDIARLIVPLIGATYLLKSVAFLCIYFVVLWLIVRWDTQRRAARFIKRSSSGLTAATLEWVDELSAPIREHCQRVESLCSQLDQARKNSAA
ncbi:MAG: hypothetical protein ACREJC_21385, partial [Tepidisphaeraceae bacterium]